MKTFKTICTFLSIITIFNCSSSTVSDMEVSNLPPSWIHTHGPYEFVGTGTAKTLDEATQIAQSNALNEIVMSVRGGVIRSNIGYDIQENDGELKETFQQLSNLTIEGYVQVTTHSTYHERELLGSDLVYKCYVLMNFDYLKYSQWLMDQAASVESVLHRLETMVADADKIESPDRLVEIFTLLKMASTTLNELKSTAGKTEQVSRINQIHVRFSMLVNQMLKSVQLSQTQASIMVNPFSTSSVKTPVQIKTRTGASLSSFPYYCISQDDKEIVYASTTDEQGYVHLINRGEKEVGQVKRFLIIPPIDAIDPDALSSVPLELIYKYTLSVDLDIKSESEQIQIRDVRHSLATVLEEFGIQVDNPDVALGKLTGNFPSQNLPSFMVYIILRSTRI